MFENDDILEGAIKELGLKDEEDKDEDELEEDELEDEEDELEDEEEESEESDEEESDEEEDEELDIEEEEENKGTLGALEFKAAKPTQEDKQKYAFEKLRKENKEKNDELKKLNDIAKLYGYDSHKVMLEALEKDALQKQAKKSGVDPVFYEDLQKTKRELESLKEQQKLDLQRVQVTEINTRIEGFLKEKGLSDSDKVTLISKLEEDGFTLDTLANMKNYKQVFSGYMLDRISAAEKQKELQKVEKKKNLSERKMQTTETSADKLNLDKLVGDLLKSVGSNRY
jgi:hypothetical protein